MIPQETAGVLAALNATWPRQALSGPTLDVWMEQLRRVDVRDAQAAVIDLGRSTEWMPALSQFVAACQAAARARIAAEQESRMLEADTGPVLTKEEQMENVAKARALVSQVSKRVPG